MEKVSEHSSGPEATESMQAMPCPVCDKALKKAPEPEVARIFARIFGRVFVSPVR